MATVNPFEPPRSTDIGALGSGSPAGNLPDEAVAELVASGPWARWSTRLAVVGLLVSVVSAVVSLVRNTPASEKVASMVSLAISLPITLLFVVLFRRYAGHAEALRDGRPGALPGVVDAQRSVFKAYGIFSIIMLVLVVLGMIIAIAAARLKGVR